MASLGVERSFVHLGKDEEVEHNEAQSAPLQVKEIGNLAEAQSEV